MRLGWKTFVAILLLAVVGVGLGVLIDPGTPSGGSSLRFVGYVPLARSGVLNVFDYLTIDGDKLFVAGISSGTVSRLTIGRKGLPQEVATFAGKPVAHGVAIDPVSHMAFVSRSGANTVEVFDPATMESVKIIPVADDPDAIVYAAGLIYVAHGDGKVATLIDPATQTVAGTIPLGGKGEFAAYDSASGLMYQNVEDTDELVAIDLARRTVVGRWKTDGCVGPSGLALDAAARRLIVACGGNSRAAIFDLGMHRSTATYQIGKHPDTIAYDTGLRRIYSAGAFGEMSVLQGDATGAFHTADTVHTHLGAHTLAVDPVSHRVYVGYAGLLVGPRIAVFDAQP